MFEWHPDNTVTSHDDPLDLRDEMPSRYLKLLANAAEQLLDADDPARMVDRLFEMIAGELRLDVFVNYRFDGDGLTLEAHGGLSEREAADRAVLALGQAICGRVARDRNKIHVTAIQSSDDPGLAFAKDIGLDSYACTPLVHGGELLGTLGFGRRWAGRFSDDELSLLHTVCHYVAIAKHRLRIEAALHEGMERQERLLQELNHRVRNALQLAIGLVGMEFRAPEADSAEAAKRRAVARLEVMSAAHGSLYRSHRLDAVDIGTLVTGVVDQTLGHAVPMTAEGVHTLPVERAVALALVIHALLLDLPGPESIALGRAADGLLVLTLAGPPGGNEPLPRSTRLLLRQLQGTIDHDPSGTTIRFTEEPG